MKKIDRGAKLAAKGQTITGNQARTYLAASGGVAVSWLVANRLNNTINHFSSTGTLRAGHLSAAKAISTLTNAGVKVGATAYALKKYSDNNALRAYQRSQWNGESTIKRVGSSEYEDVVKRRSQK